jgi:serine/threonine protein kinase
VPDSSDQPLASAQPDAPSDGSTDETATATPRSRSVGSNFGPPAAPGEVGSLGPYRLVKELGKGGMGAVYLAIDARLGRKLALKVMLPEFAADHDAKERFLREARAAAMITHDNVVTVYEADEREGVPYIAMQFLKGYPLDQFLKEKGAPALPHVIRIAREAALGLSAAHEIGLVHRDIKPGNLWLEAPNGRVKVLDFGLAKPIESDTEVTKSGAVVGTPAYMSPEQARGEKVDHRTDLFSLGGMLYRLCTGKTPFAGPNVTAVLIALGSDEPTPVRELNPSVPKALAELIHQLLAKKPEQRPQTATEVAKRLRGILDQLLHPGASAPVSAARAPNPPGADLSGSRPVVVGSVPHQPPIVVPMQITGQSDDVFAHLDEPSAAGATDAEPIAPMPERKKGGKGLLLAVGGAVLLVAVAVAVVVSQRGKKGESNVEKPPEAAPPVVKVSPKDGGKLPAGSIPVLKPVGNDWVDVLARAEPTIEVSEQYGRWQRRNGKLVADGTKAFSAFHLPLRATGSYNLVVEAALESGSEVLVIVLPIGERNAVGFDLNAWGGTVRSFNGINGTSTNNERNPTRVLQKAPIEPGQGVKIALAVKRTGDQVALEATINNEAPIQWSGPLAALTFSGEAQSRPGGVSLYSHGACRWAVHSLKFQKIDGEAAVLDWGPPGSDPDRRIAEWVLALGGTLRIDGKGDVKVVAELPREWFGLETVDLGRTHVSDADLERLKELKALTALYLWETQVTDAGLAHITELKTLVALGLGSTKVSDACLVHLKELKNLTWLNMSGTKVTDDGLLLLGEFKGMRALDLGDTNVTDAGFAHLKDLKALEELSLPGTRVSDVSLVHLRELKNLTSLNVRKTNVTVKGLEDLAAAVPGCKIEHDGGTIEPKK